MKTTIYWTALHIRRAAHDLHFKATCWWLSQQVELLRWRLRLGALMPHAQSDPTPTSAGPADRYAVHLM
jgi:hypothetical protein